MANTIRGGGGNSFAFQSFNKSTRTLKDAAAKLASGKRIEKASDDAAGLAVGTALQVLATLQGQGIRNANDGGSLIASTEGTLESTTSSLQRLQELAVQSSNGTLNDEQRGAIDQEAQQLIQEIDRQAATTNFNGINTLDGSSGSVDIQVGPDTQNGSVGIPTLDARAASLGVGSLDLSTQAGASAAISQIDGAIANVSSARGELGAAGNRLESAINTAGIAQENLAASASTILDADFAKQAGRYKIAQVQQSAGARVLQLQGASQANVVSKLIGIV